MVDENCWFGLIVIVGVHKYWLKMLWCVWTSISYVLATARCLLKCSTVVWEKFTIGYFRVKVVCGKIFSSLEVSDENFLTTKYFKVKLFVPLLTNLMHSYT